MDLKIKSNKWVGNICHRFESICQDVDGFISKKTVKYVEDQVQTVGLNVKQFYSGIVEDILPELEDNIKSEESAMTDKQVHTEDSLNSTMATEEKPVNRHEKQLSTEQGSPAEYPLGEEEFDMPLEQDGDCIISNNSDKVIVENTGRDLVPSESDDVHHNNATETVDSSQAPLVDEVGFMALPEEGILSKRFSDYIDCASDSSSNGWECELNLPEVEESNFDGDRSSSLQPVTLVDKSEKDVSLFDNFSTQDECLNGSSNVQSPEEADNKSGNDASLFNNISIQDECLNGSSNVKSPEEADNKSEKDASLFYRISIRDECLNGSSNVQSPEEADNGDISSRCSASSILWESTFAKFVHMAEDTSNPHVNSVDCIDDESNDHISSKSSITYLLESNDTETPTTYRSVSLVGSSEAKGETCCDSSQSNMFISPTENGSVDRLGRVISDLNMETIDLSNRVEHDGHGAIVNGNPAYRASFRGRNFRYYKNLIKDAFGSRKRITKEYEHLGISYGDIDKELWQHFEPSSLPSTPTSSSLLLRSPLHATSESDWELL